MSKTEMPGDILREVFDKHEYRMADFPMGFYEQAAIYEAMQRFATQESLKWKQDAERLYKALDELTDNLHKDMFDITPALEALAAHKELGGKEPINIDPDGYVHPNKGGKE